MNYIKSVETYSIYLFIFSLSFGSGWLNFLNFGVEFLLTKMTIFILFLIAIFHFKLTYSLNNFSKYLYPIIFYFTLLTIISLINATSLFYNFFDFYLFVDILIFLVLVNYSKIIPDVLLKSLLIFSISTFVLSIFYLSGVGIIEELEGRFSLFGINTNILGLCACISLLILLSVIFENKLKFGKNRFLLLLLLPFLTVLMLSTGSRVSFISLILGIAIFLLNKKNIASVKKIIFTIFASTLLLLIWSLFLKNSLVVERLSSSINEGDLSYRDVIWLSLFDIISNNFIWGVGKTGYAEIIGDFSPHNVILEVLCYTGIIGLTIFLIFFIRILVNAYKSMKNEYDLLPMVLIVPIIGMILSGQIFDQKIVWVILAYIASREIKRKKLSRTISL